MLSSQEIDLVDLIYKQHSNLFEPVSDSKEIDKNLYEIAENSVLLSSYNDIWIHEALRVLDCNMDTRLLVVQVTYAEFRMKRIVDASEVQLIGLKILDHDYGHLLIRPETVEDKINEFFKKCEIDFRDFPTFSSRYYYLAKDDYLGISFATPNRLGLMEKQNEITIEVKGDILVAKYPRIINASDFNNMLNFIKEI